MTNKRGLSILNARNRSERQTWLKVWHAWPHREVFAHPDYVTLGAGHLDCPLCALWLSEGLTVIYPFILRPLTQLPCYTEDLGHCTDISTPYGYGGAFAWGETSNREEKAQQFWKLFRSWAAKQKVVSEFIRFSLFEEDLLPYDEEPLFAADNVILDLRPSLEEIWGNFRHKVRKNVRRAEKNGLEVMIDTKCERMDDFLRIYHETMKRREATATYWLERKHFETINSSLAGHVVYFHAMSAGETISSEMCLVSSRSVYSFLGGTEEKTFNLRPNDFLKYAIIRWAKDNNKIFFVLGGGYTPEDGVFRYKASFAPDGIRPFRTGKKILNKSLYLRLVQNLKVPGSNQLHSGFFPEYRSASSLKRL